MYKTKFIVIKLSCRTNFFITIVKL